MSTDRRRTAGRAPAQPVDLHIEELVLHGIAAGDEAQVAAAVRQELTRLLATDGVGGRLTRSGDFGTVDGGAVTVDGGAGGEDVGRAVAGAVYRGLER